MAVLESRQQTLTFRRRESTLRARSRKLRLTGSPAPPSARRSAISVPVVIVQNATELMMGDGHIERPNTVVMQYIVLFSHRTVALPSLVLSQKHDVAVCNPAPFFCTTTVVTESKDAPMEGPMQG